MLLEFQERLIMVEEWWSFAKKGDSVWVTHLKHRSLHKYTRVARVRDGVEIKSMIDLMLVNRDMCRMRGMGRGLSDPYVALCKVRLV